MNQIYKDKIDELAYEFGLEPQKNQLVEEMAELTQVICKINRLKVPKGVPVAPGIDLRTLEEAFIEELADVNIVLQQCIRLVGQKEVERVMMEKIDRTFSRMGKTTKIS